MLLYSWNVNGFRALCGKEEWSRFRRTNADLVALQEVKAEEAQIPEVQRRPGGCHSYWFSAAKKKGYSGVAVFCREKPLAVARDLPQAAFQGEGRLLHLEFPAFHFLNVYFPNGQMNEDRLAYKLGFYDAFLEHAQNLRREKPLVICGDFNTAHRPVDIARPRENENTSGFLPVERAWMDKFIAHGYVDTLRLVRGETPGLYSWWSYRFRARERNVGWRIDYFFVSDELLEAVRDAWIATEILGSDHCPVGLELADNRLGTL
ncbi:MAG: exodeoxyribonuclease III [Desulfovibrio sp.]|jgi:exodeoxyribonuclease-3|nr:exodeoxyribonuclease III [Desulfovibrio sp.]